VINIKDKKISGTPFEVEREQENPLDPFDKQIFDFISWRDIQILWPAWYWNSS